MKNKKVVVIGGGHGQSTILRGLKAIKDIDLTAIVTVADDGGSTGRLRRQFHIPAMGDIRNVLLALAESESLLNDLMEYRFEETEEDSEIGGHNLGNLILTAMTQRCGSFMESIATLSKVLRVKGDIIPSTSQVITLFARMEDGTIVRGESNIPNMKNHIREVFYEEEVHATQEAIHAISNADLIILGIGSVYTSILPNTIIPEIKDALNRTNALKCYICNAMSQPGETDGYTMEDHVRAIRDHGSDVDVVLFANDSIPPHVLKRYAEEGSCPVEIKEKNHDFKIIKANLLEFNANLIRHNSLKIKEAVEEILKRM